MLTVAALLVVAGCTPPGLPAPIVPTASASASGVAPPPDTLIVGVDQAPAGFNPHALADYSVAGQAVAGLVLPSAFTVDAAGNRVLSADLLESAQIVTQTPFTVSYRLNRAAAWSDGTPISAEDFSYLRDAMTAQPGTVDPAGYRLISAIRSVDAGKTVQVQFTQPVADWQTLFSPLVPAHIMKDSPSGWAGALSTGIPVSGNRYKMIDLDTTTGEVTLARNDKFWGSQPGPASVVLRVGTSAALLAALDRGDIQAALLAPAAAQALPASRRTAIRGPGAVSLVFDTRAGATADRDVRTAVGLGLDGDRLRADLAGGSGTPSALSILPVSSQVSLPTTTTSAGASTSWGSGDITAATAALKEAGYRRAGVYLTKDGSPLRLTLQFLSTDERLAATALDIQRQLGQVGIEVDLAPLDTTLAIVDRALGLTTQATSGGMSLLFVTRDTSDALTAGSAFGCPGAGAANSGPASRTPAPTPPATGGNLSGYCAQDLDLVIGQAISSGAASGLSQVDSRLWSDLPVIPIGTPMTTFAVGNRLTAVIAAAGPGWTWTGPLAGLPSWSAR